MERREESEREEKLGLLVGRWPPLSASAASPLIMINRDQKVRGGEGLLVSLGTE